MSELRALYQEVILDHYKRPRNFGPLEDSNRQAEGYNPLCGDKVKVFLHLDGDVIRGLSFQGAGCAISTASASLMTEALRGKSLEEAERLFRKFHDLVTGQGERDAATALDDPELGKLAVLSGVRDYPVRIKCATLAWHAVRAAIENETEPVTTE